MLLTNGQRNVVWSWPSKPYEFTWAVRCVNDAVDSYDDGEYTAYAAYEYAYDDDGDNYDDDCDDDGKVHAVSSTAIRSSVTAAWASWANTLCIHSDSDHPGHQPCANQIVTVPFC